MYWQTSRFQVDLKQPCIMGIVNLTPDSFSDGGLHGRPEQASTTASALQYCERLIREGAGILDLGGESSRPGAAPVSLQEELARLMPVLREALTLGVPISIDTCKPAVMQAALDMGADIINDISALRQSGSDRIVAAHPACGVCVMHMHRDPQSMQRLPMQGDAVPQVLLFLEQIVQHLYGLGIAKTRIVMDPGIGFGKTPAQNFALLARQDELIASIGVPLLAGWSRKSSLAAKDEKPADLLQAHGLTHPRLIASVTAAVLAVGNGAHIVRVHDVAATAQALQVWQSMRQQAV